MAQTLFTPLATEDLQQIWDFLAEKAGTQTAYKFLVAIRDKCQMLAEFPDSGRARHEFIINLRSFPFKNYVIFYMPQDGGIEVLRIVHSSRDMQQIFDEMIPLES
jgi:toxin ParE1/3/4